MNQEDAAKPLSAKHRATRYALKIGLFVGVGIVGSLDSIVFHELLQ